METIIPIGYWIFFIFTIVGTLAGLYKMFEKAGEAGWKALVPFLNAWICVKITGKSRSWFIMLMIPVLNVVVWLLMSNELAKVFGKESFWAYVGSMMIPYIYFLKLGFDEDVRYIGPHKSERKSVGREWADAIAFAVVAATLIRTFFFEAYTIPTTSMEGTLKAGDFLFVSKFHYGARFPITPLAFPFAHHTMPVIGGKAYSDAIKMPYMRFPGLENIHRGSSVVFNFPAGDTVYLPEQQNSYYSLLMNEATNLQINDAKLGNRPKPFSFYYNRVSAAYRSSGELAYRPVDKRDNYIKRCVGLPGDSLWVSNGILYVNGEKAYVAPEQQKSYDVTFKAGLGVDAAAGILLKMKLNSMDFEDTVNVTPNKIMITANMSIADSKLLAKNKQVESVILNHFDRMVAGYIGLFPNNPNQPLNSVDDFSPIYIPKKGATVKIDANSYYNYKRIIEAYEHNTVTLDKQGRPYIDGKLLTEYTFKQNYYWMMGDNRHRSYDSRYWGYVPEDHIVGKPVLLWFSWDKTLPLSERIANIRWDRMMHFK
ncbi:MAG TPA: S26 family signal peptidase [Chitinophagales bacterium]|nr:S26 family signal peptidase [Chitinophagales bacterium]HMX03330.1 S26 family signal peptidase [Chitinophagales bacterium]HMZ87972.1 S26 family signal peptidase [Chitinophagales bacterium]HNA58423.1 S26 family signal peptidase [Chitinophagales bacterium]HNE44729.1 S26 family signal peptidase [Chitinophagales bacterium]